LETESNIVELEVTVEIDDFVQVGKKQKKQKKQKKVVLEVQVETSLAGTVSNDALDTVSSLINENNVDAPAVELQVVPAVEVEKVPEVEAVKAVTEVEAVKAVTEVEAVTEVDAVEAVEAEVGAVESEAKVEAVPAITTKTLIADLKENLKHYLETCDDMPRICSIPLPPIQESGFNPYAACCGKKTFGFLTKYLTEVAPELMASHTCKFNAIKSTKDSPASLTVSFQLKEQDAATETVPAANASKSNKVIEYPSYEEMTAALNAAVPYKDGLIKSVTLLCNGTFEEARAEVEQRYGKNCSECKHMQAGDGKCYVRIYKENKPRPARPARVPHSRGHGK
jgi:hypothetical protein